jgi:pimeloyl-ACP methyl ester carboxylesterase
MNAATMRGRRGNGNHDPPIKVDYLEAGSSGPVVMLVHSSVSGARQWRRLMGDLKDQFRVRAVNLFGYGKTPAWPGETIQSLDDQARLVEAALPANADEVYLVGHSFGGSVAMKAAARLAGRVARLVLLETNPFISSHNPATPMHSLRPGNYAIISRNLERLANGRLRPKNSPTTGVAPERGARCRWTGASRLRKPSSRIFSSGTR